MANAILVADDDPDILSIVSMSLETQGYTVHTATNGREAVDLARQHHPDLILMDMMMPVLSGYEAVGELKADAATRDIVIVGLSAKAMATDMERATDVGIDGYITKPFRIAQILHRRGELPHRVAARRPKAPVVRADDDGQEPAPPRRSLHVMSP